MKLENKLLGQLRNEKLLPLYVVKDLTYLDKLEIVLLNNNLHFMEIVYRSNQASEAIKYLANSGKLIVGAGTVRDLSTAKEAINNGAQFIVTPGYSKEIVEYCQECNTLCFPGAVTPSEIMDIMSLNLSTVKFFPANVYGGLDAINALSAPFYDIEFIPTGGVNKDNVLDYLKNESVLAVGGSFIISEEMIKNDNGEKVNQHLKELTTKIYS